MAAIACAEPRFRRAGLVPRRERIAAGHDALVLLAHLDRLLRPPMLSLRQAGSSLRCSPYLLVRLRCSLLSRLPRFGLVALATATK